MSHKEAIELLMKEGKQASRWVEHLATKLKTETMSDATRKVLAKQLDEVHINMLCCATLIAHLSRPHREVH